MASDILESVREEILKEDEKNLPWVPKSLDKTWEMQAGIAGALAGAAAGFAIGAHMGLAGPWGAIAGTIPVTVIGGVLGYFTGAKAGSKFQREWTGFEGFSGADSTPRISGTSSSTHSQQNNVFVPEQPKARLEPSTTAETKELHLPHTWKASDLPTQVGFPYKDGIAASGQRKGFLTYGPYYKGLTPGDYKVVFALSVALSDGWHGDAMVDLDVYKSSKNIVLSRRTIYRHLWTEANTYQEFGMSFKLD